MTGLCFYVIVLLLALAARAVRIDDCNLAYWKPKLMNTILVDDMHMAPRRCSKKLSFYENIPKPKRILGPHTEVKDTSIDTKRINILVDDRYVVVGVDCF
ncbi:hypothetical protein IWW57_003154 [Coemansia sp. S610]|uniref:Uncharacterized protein n=1 Tax=Coemansia linderi TaxID=2663919 RepID=A0ACC1KQ90_9FUNG|nr:hypothetical protein LPJ60_004421 [Coemansia sp. RSA 2675]KAJ2026093.1 hypothetical protein IWW57_003154 [Coemansia sp. S610]KAJ2792752.1 hypothetical protein GGI18_000123 [Coemansia linderi]